MGNKIRLQGSVILPNDPQKSQGSKATPSATRSFKNSYKISHLPQLWTTSDALHSFAVSSKIGHYFSNKGVLKLKLAKNAFYKKGAP